MMAPLFTFHPVTAADISRLNAWTSRPHVAEWWPSDGTTENWLDHSPDVRRFIAWLDGRAMAYVQSYVAIESEGGWWQGQHDRGVLGIDQFLADADDLGKGLGTTMVRQFVQWLFEDPAIWKIQLDPSPANPRAIRLTPGRPATAVEVPLRVRRRRRGRTTP